MSLACDDPLPQKTVFCGLGATMKRAAPALVLASAFWIACSTTPGTTVVVPAAVDVDGSAEGGGGGACDLHASGVAFPSAACNECMQAKCCEKTVACFSRGAADCAELHTCLEPCPRDSVVIFGDEGGGGGGDGGGGGGGDGGGGGRGCRATCEAAHPNSVTNERLYDGCIRSNCLTECAW